MSAVLKPEPKEIISKSEEIAGKGEQARAVEPINIGGKSPISKNKELPEMSVPANDYARRSGQGGIHDKVREAKPAITDEIKMDQVKGANTNSPDHKGLTNDGPSNDGPKR